MKSTISAHPTLIERTKHILFRGRETDSAQILEPRKLLCEDFGANCTCQAISGKGIYHNCCDNGVTMNEIGLNILPGEPSCYCVADSQSRMDHPQLVI